MTRSTITAIAATILSLTTVLVAVVSDGDALVLVVVSGALATIAGGAGATLGWTEHRRASAAERKAVRAAQEASRAREDEIEAKCKSIERELAEARASAASESLSGNALSRAIVLLRETAPIVKGLSETAIEKSKRGSTSLTDDIYDLGEKSTTLSTTISEFLSEICTGDESLEHNISELNDDIARLSEIAGRYDETNRSLDTSVKEMSDSIGETVGLLTQVSDIAEQTNILAINAAIYAAKAGEFGRGFSVIASEIQKLARTSKGVAEAIGSNTSGIETQVSSLGKAHRRLIEESQASLNQTIRSIQHTVGELRPQLDGITRSVQTAAETSDVVAERLNGINVTMQQHDAIQQIIAHISDILFEALDEAPDREIAGETLNQVREQARALASRHFTMKDEFEAVGQSGYKVAESTRAVLEDGTELAGDVTLF